jgi:hypothetical protein
LGHPWPTWTYTTSIPSATCFDGNSQPTLFTQGAAKGWMHATISEDFSQWGYHPSPEQESEMAIEYDLHLSTHLKPAQALEKLIRQIPGPAWSEDRTFLVDTSAHITAAESHAITPLIQGVIEDSFHFTPTLWVGFRRLADADWDRFRQVLLDASLALLDESKDAVLLLNGERIELQRLGGRLAFNAESGYWRDEDWLKSRLTHPFERRPLPSPLL